MSNANFLSLQPLGSFQVSNFWVMWQYKFPWASSHLRFENTLELLSPEHTGSYCHIGRLYRSCAQKLWSELLVPVNEHFLFSHKSSYSLLSVSLAQTDFTTHGFNLGSFTFLKITRISNSCCAASVCVEKHVDLTFQALYANKLWKCIRLENGCFQILWIRKILICPGLVYGIPVK